MDVDSAMMTEADHVPAVLTVSSPTAMDREQQVDDQTQPAGSPTAAATTPPTSGQPQSAVVGPRTAPTYSVVDAIIEKKEDGPGPRCGHTLTAVAAVGEEGTPGYIGPRLILFGGATALEGNSAASGTPSSAGNAGIRTCFI
uniref:Serine/threonine-protein phosphatase BSL3 isoform X3 n=1 Tax=Rhizophora mucronata TaxID=61149 RepID=A0A2P2MSG3_RHIMU